MRVQSMTLRVSAAAVQVLPGRRRMLGGTVLRYGETGRTSVGPLVVDPGSLHFPADLTAVPMTRDHDQPYVIRGRLALVDDNAERIYVVTRPDDGPAGDAAIEEAQRRVRAAFSFDVTNAVVDAGHLVYADVRAIGQVDEPAFNSARIDQIAATYHQGAPMTAQQLARLVALRAQLTLTQAEAGELAQLTALEAGQVTPVTTPAPQTVPQTAAQTAAPAAPAPPAAPASTSAVPPAASSTSAPAPAAPAAPAPAGAIAAAAPGARPPAATTNPTSALRDFVRRLSDEARAGTGVAGLHQVITAALKDVTQGGARGVGGDIEAPAWSRELWSGLQYKAKYSPLLASGDLTNWSGVGWRWVTKPEMDDYAGDKKQIPSNELATEQSGYEAHRMATGHDLDRKFFDFPSADNEAFVISYLEAVRESWAEKLDRKAEDYIIATAADAARTVPQGLGILPMTGYVIQGLDDDRMGQASFVLVNSDDRLELLEIAALEVPAYLAMFHIKPEQWVASNRVPAGTVIAGVRQAAQLRTVKGSPIQVQAQNVPRGGVDLAAFGYYAIETHALLGIQQVRAGQSAETVRAARAKAAKERAAAAEKQKKAAA